MVGRRKSTDILPPRMYAYRGKRKSTYYTITAGNQRINLGHDLLEAKRKLLDIEAGRPVAGTIADLFERYMPEVSAKKAPATHKDEKASKVFLLKVFGKMRPQDVRPVHVARYLDERGKTAPVRANREKSLLSHLFSIAMRWGILDANPCKGVARNTETPRDRLVTDRELCGFMAHAIGQGETGSLLALAAWLAYLTGQRGGDLLALRLDKITDDGLMIQQTKTGARVLVEWTDRLRECVAELRTLPRPIRGLYLICNRAGQPYTATGFKALWGRAMTAWVDEGGERFHFHDLRAKAITRMVEDGREAKQLSGHATDAMVAKVYDRRAFKRSKAVE